MSEWDETTLGDVINFQRGHDITRATQRDGKVPVVSSGGIGSYHDTAAAKAPGVVIGRKGTLGKVFYMSEDYWPHDTTLWVQDFKGSHPRFVYYFMTQFDTAWLDAGSANPTLNRNHLHPLRVLWPSLPNQRAIAEVLGALDDKIAANTKLAATSDEWVRAGLAAVVEGATETVPVKELATNRKELAEPSTLDPDSKYVGLEHLPRRSMWADSAGTAKSVSSTKAKFEEGDILFGKLRPYFHKVVVAPFGGVCSTDVLVLRPSSSDLAGYVLASLSSDFVVERATAASEGTRMPRTSWKDLAAVEVAWPGLTVAREFGARVSAVRGAVESLLGENQTLAATRDALLPQLMSGKLV
ncbi:restriction endonuclease subunit S [Arthrobacter sp. UYEF3]|uniref:restriction endonuclease subunit S n=1 Tax=Arthrobacter sp. UYEF3 TaxID=1756365 RepID=UPI0033998E13